MTKTPDHITRELLRAARRGDLSYRHLAEIQRAHLETVCPHCRRESEAERAEETLVEAYREPVRRVSRAARLEAELDAIREEAEIAPELLAALRELSLEQRLLRIRNAPDRFANRVLCEELFELARACLPADPMGSRGWAETARAVAESYSVPYPSHQIRAIAFQANAFRAAGDFDTALVLFRQARDLIDEHDVTDLELGAELHSFLGSLNTDLRRFEQAGEHLESAANLYRILGHEEQLARVLMKLANLHRCLGDLEAALEADHAALGLLTPEAHPRLYTAARFNFASNLAATGRHEAARETLAYDENLYEQHADNHTRLRVRWLEGRIAAAIGDSPAAERAFLAVLDKFASQGHGFNAAIACLDLAALYHQEGRLEDLEQAATQAVQLFQAHEIHRDALAALLLLQEAAVTRKLTADTIRRIAAFLQEAQRDPAVRFDAPN